MVLVFRSLFSIALKFNCPFDTFKKDGNSDRKTFLYYSINILIRIYSWFGKLVKLIYQPLWVI